MYLLTFLCWDGRLDLVINGLERPAVLHVILIGLHEQRDPASPNTGIYKCNRKRPMPFVSC